MEELRTPEPRSARLGAVLFANSAEVREHLVNVLSAGWSTYTTGSDNLAVFTVVFWMEFDRATSTEVAVGFINPKGERVTECRFSFENIEGPCPRTVEVRGPMTPGRWSLVFTIGDLTLHTRHFSIIGSTASAKQTDNPSQA